MELYLDRFGEKPSGLWPAEGGVSEDIIPLIQKEGIKLLDFLRKNKIQSETDYQDKSLKAAMRRADDLGVRFVIIIGEDELKKNAVTLKDMISGEQKEISSQELLKEIKAIC